MAEAMGPLDLKIGVIEIGVLISMFLYGITTVQAYTYFRKSTRDPQWLRGMVAIIWILETFIAVATCVYLYDLTIINFGKFDSLQDMPWTLDFSFFIGGLVSATVQSFFAYRVRVISGKWSISVVAWVGSIARVGLTLTISILTSKSGTLDVYQNKYHWSIISSLVVAMFIDILNTCSLCYYLHKMRTQFKGTNALIDRIMTWSIETGLLTSVCAVLMLILELARPDWNVWFGILMFYVKLYSNSLLLFLNGRSSLRGSSTLSSFKSLPHLPRAHTIINVSQTTEVMLEMGNVKPRQGEGGHIDDLPQDDSEVFSWRKTANPIQDLSTDKLEPVKRVPDVLDSL